jgi:hypothetical protein
MATPPQTKGAILLAASIRLAARWGSKEVRQSQSLERNAQSTGGMGQIEQFMLEPATD